MLANVAAAHRALDDVPAAVAALERAVQHARRCGDAAAEVITQTLLGLVDVSSGRLRVGFELLDGGTAAALAGEVDTLTALDVHCLLLTACERVRDFDRVDQWASRVLAMATEVGSDAFATFARTQYANSLVWRGRWTEAERELDRILVDAANRPLAAAMGMVLRASPRRRQGRLDDALAELARAEMEPFRRAVRSCALRTSGHGCRGSHCPTPPSRWAPAELRGGEGLGTAWIEQGTRELLTGPASGRGRSAGRRRPARPFDMAAEVLEFEHRWALPRGTV